MTVAATLATNERRAASNTNAIRIGVFTEDQYLVAHGEHRQWGRIQIPSLWISLRGRGGLGGVHLVPMHFTCSVASFFQASFDVQSSVIAESFSSIATTTKPL